MFIREKTKVDKKTGKKYSSYQLVEAIRTAHGPRQVIHMTIGSEINLSPGERKELANRIEDIIKGSNSLLLPPNYIENLAQHFAKLLLLQQSAVQTIEDTQEPSDFQNIDINTICHTKVRTIGPEYVALSAYRELDFDGVFSRLNFTEKQRHAAAASIIGRAIYPSSERALHTHMLSRSGLDQLLNVSSPNLTLDQLYSISDHLYDAKDTLERYLRKREKTLFNLQESIILYDITNTYFEGACKEHSKAKRGKSKEMRFDCPLLAFGVVLDSDGFPKHSEIFEGNVNERETLQEMILKLNKSNITKKPIIVLDSGIATKDNIEWLKSQEYLYIVMMKRKDRPPSEDCKEVVIRNNGDQFISATLKYDPETEDHLLWCFSEGRLKKEQDIRQHKTNALEGALKRLKEGLPIKGRIRTFEKVHQKIGRLREKYARLAQHYDIHVIASEDGVLAKDITWTYNETKVEKSFSGTYTLRTNVKELSPEVIWEIYVMLSEAESCFRCLKSEAGLRPNWHHIQKRIDSHMFISLLAYHLIITIRKKLKSAGIMDSWETIREKLASHAIVNTTLKTREGDTIYLKKTSEPDANQCEIYRALGLSFRPVKTEKSFVGKDVVPKI